MQIELPYPFGAIPINSPTALYSTLQISTTRPKDTHIRGFRCKNNNATARVTGTPDRFMWLTSLFVSPFGPGEAMHANIKHHGYMLRHRQEKETKQRSGAFPELSRINGLEIEGEDEGGRRGLFVKSGSPKRSFSDASSAAILQPLKCTPEPSVGASKHTEVAAKSKKKAQGDNSRKGVSDSTSSTHLSPDIIFISYLIPGLTYAEAARLHDQPTQRVRKDSGNRQDTKFVAIRKEEDAVTQDYMSMLELQNLLRKEMPQVGFFQREYDHPTLYHRSSVCCLQSGTLDKKASMKFLRNEGVTGYEGPFAEFPKLVACGLILDAKDEDELISKLNGLAENDVTSKFEIVDHFEMSDTAINRALWEHAFARSECCLHGYRQTYQEHEKLLYNPLTPEATSKSPKSAKEHLHKLVASWKKGRVYLSEAVAYHFVANGRIINRVIHLPGTKSLSAVLKAALSLIGTEDRSTPLSIYACEVIQLIRAIAERDKFVDSETNTYFTLKEFKPPIFLGDRTVSNARESHI